MNDQKAHPSYRRQFIYLTSLFFLWGFITVLVDSLIPRLREVFTLSYFQAGLVQFAFFMAYFILSIPAGFILAKIGYKKGIVLGLGTMALGCALFYPAASFRIFPVFMVAYFVLAGGMTILQVAANPYVAALGPESSASSRLNLSQAFNSLGTTLAPIAGAILILSDNVMTSEEISALGDTAREVYYEAEASAVQLPFVFLTVFIVIMAIVFATIRLPKLMSDVPVRDGYSRLLKNRTLMMGAFGILVYVGAEVAIGSYLVNYFLDMKMDAAIRESPFFSRIAETLLNAELTLKDNKAIVGAFVTFYWSGAMIGRFVGAYLTKIFRPSLVLRAFALGSITMILISMSTNGFVSMWSILAVGLFNSIMFPTIFTMALDGLQSELKPQASGILCTMIVGGALIPPAYGYFTDMVGFKTAFILVIVCYTYILSYGWYKSKRSVSSALE